MFLTFTTRVKSGIKLGNQLEYVKGLEIKISNMSPKTPEIDVSSYSA